MTAAESHVHARQGGIVMKNPVTAFEGIGLPAESREGPPVDGADVREMIGFSETSESPADSDRQDYQKPVLDRALVAA